MSISMLIVTFSLKNSALSFYITKSLSDGKTLNNIILKKNMSLNSEKRINDGSQEYYILTKFWLDLINIKFDFRSSLVQEISNFNLLFANN